MVNISQQHANKLFSFSYTQKVRMIGKQHEIDLKKNEHNTYQYAPEADTILNFITINYVRLCAELPINSKKCSQSTITLINVSTLGHSTFRHAVALRSGPNPVPNSLIYHSKEALRRFVF